MTNIHVNFSDDEASSEARTYEVVPTGEYNVAVTECELKAVAKQGENHGKPFYNMKLIIQGGKYEGKWLFVSVMLFEIISKKDGKGKNFLLSQLIKSLGVPVIPDQETAVPSAADIQGKKLVAVVAKEKDDHKSEPGSVVYKATVKGFKSVTGMVSSSASYGGNPPPTFTGPASTLP